MHWARFPAFRHVRHELQKPHLTMCEKDRGAVFMRWKEKFLVPDHRVQDISGASFAGESGSGFCGLWPACCGWCAVFQVVCSSLPCCPFVTCRLRAFS